MIVSCMTSFSPMDSMLSYFQIYHWGDNDLIFKVSTGFRVVNCRQNKLVSGTVQVLSPISISVCQMFFFSNCMDISLRQAKDIIKVW